MKALKAYDKSIGIELEEADYSTVGKIIAGQTIGPAFNAANHIAATLARPKLKGG